MDGVFFFLVQLADRRIVHIGKKHMTARLLKEQSNKAAANIARADHNCLFHIFSRFHLSNRTAPVPSNADCSSRISSERGGVCAFALSAAATPAACPVAMQIAMTR